MTKHTLQVPDELYERLAAAASEAGRTPDEVILAAIRQHLEDAEDLRAIAEYERQQAEGTLKTISLDELSERLGLEH